MIRGPRDSKKELIPQVLVIGCGRKKGALENPKRKWYEPKGPLGMGFPPQNGSARRPGKNLIAAPGDLREIETLSRLQLMDLIQLRKSA